MLESNAKRSVTHSSSTAASISTKPPSSCPSTLSCWTLNVPTPDIIDGDPSNSVSSSGEPITQSPSQEYALLDHEDGLKLESNNLNQELAGSEPASRSPVQGYVPPHHQDGVERESKVSEQEISGREPTARSPVQEDSFSRSQEGQASSVTMVVQSVLCDDNEQAPDSSQRIPNFNPESMVTDESTDSIRSHGFGQDSRECSAIAGFPNRQQAQLTGSDRSSGYASLGDNSSRNESSVDNQTKARAEGEHTWNHSGPARPVLRQGPRSNASYLPFNTRPHEKIVLPEPTVDFLPSPEDFDPHRSQDEHFSLTNNTSPPSNGQVLDPTPPYRRAPWPPVRWSGVHPSVWESRSLEGPVHDLRLRTGTTQPPGPPLKPFDGPWANQTAIEQQMRVANNEMR